MTQVRYTGSNKRIAGLVGNLLETRLLSLSSNETALVSFEGLPAAIRQWNLPLNVLEMVA